MKNIVTYTFFAINKYLKPETETESNHWNLKLKKMLKFPWKSNFKGHF